MHHKSHIFFYTSTLLLLAACVREGNTIRFDPSVFGKSSEKKEEAGETGTSDATAGKPRTKTQGGSIESGGEYAHLKGACMKDKPNACEEFAEALYGSYIRGLALNHRDVEQVRKEPAEVEDKIWDVSEPEKCDQKLKENIDCTKLTRFLRIFPGGGHHAEEAEKATWAGTDSKLCAAPVDSQSCGGQQFYLEHFPDGPHAAAATKAIARVQSKLDKFSAEEKAAAREQREAKEAHAEKYCPMKNGRRVSKTSYCTGLTGAPWSKCISNWNKCRL